jgi:hypothetical protein
VKVEFGKSEVRPGVPDNRSEQVTATITPVDVTVQFATSSSRAAVSPTSGQGTVTLTVDGVSLSQGNQDTQLEARIGGVVCANMPITVVEPADYEETDCTSDGPSYAVNESVWWLCNVVITIKDAWGPPLGEIWDQLPVQERIDGGGWTGFTLDSQSTGLSDGTVTDPVGFALTYQTVQEALQILQCSAPLDSDKQIVVGQDIAVILDTGQKILDGGNNRTQVIRKSDKHYSVDDTK